jgi:cysteine desulfurase/selenocysteine lyase
MIFGKRNRSETAGTPQAMASVVPGSQAAHMGRASGFEYLGPNQSYLDSACQTLRPQPVIDAMNDYYLNYNACGERAKYAWGLKVDEAVTQVRSLVLSYFGLPAQTYSASFTLNTTYGLNLLLNQLPKYASVVTTHTEHNSVFLSTMAYAQRTGAQRVLLERSSTGEVLYNDAILTNAVIVLSAMNNVDGAFVPNLQALIDDAHRVGGIVIVDGAQAAPHAISLLRGLNADAICFSAHKMYGASLGVVIAHHDLLNSLILTFIGGGQVASVTEAGYTLEAEPYLRLEPGLQAWAEIISLGAALKYLTAQANLGEGLEQREHRLAGMLYDSLSSTGKFQLLGGRGSPVISAIPKGGDGHRFAVFLSKANVMVRSGHFCAHHWLEEQRKLPPLVRFSVGAHNNDSDISYANEMITRLAKTL